MHSAQEAYRFILCNALWQLLVSPQQPSSRYVRVHPASFMPISSSPDSTHCNFIKTTRVPYRVLRGHGSCRPRAAGWPRQALVCAVTSTTSNLFTEPTIDAVKVLAQKNELPVPTALDVTALQSSTIKSTFPPPHRGPAGAPSSPAPAYSTEPDPWSAASRGLWNATNGVPVPGAAGSAGVPATSSILSSGLPPQWWKGMEQVNVAVHGQQGLFFNRFMVYSVQSYSRGVTVLRRWVLYVEVDNAHLFLGILNSCFSGIVSSSGILSDCWYSCRQNG